MRKILKFLCIISISLIPVSAFGQGSVSRPGKTQGSTPSAKNKINGHEFVDLGLPSGLKWATCNVGAASPTVYGSYFAWGETHKKSYSAKSNSQTYDSKIGDIGGNAKFDPARANWGGTWRLPTKAEFEELLKKCTWSFITMDNHNVYKVTGPNGNYIILPAAGDDYSGKDSYGYYWSSTPNGNKGSYYLHLYKSNRSVLSNPRSFGNSVRPVSK